LADSEERISHLPRARPSTEGETQRFPESPERLERRRAGLFAGTEGSGSSGEAVREAAFALSATAVKAAVFLRSAEPSG